MGRRFTFGTRLLGYKKRALAAIMRCRSGLLGARVFECKECGHREVRNNSCRVRGCPECEGSYEAKWLLERESELLPTSYFHVVFTLPHVFSELILHNERECLKLFFRAVSKTLLTVARRRFNGKLGFFAILHTWGQLLDLHYHLHCVVPGGVLTEEGVWVSTSKHKRYLLPERVLVRVFQGIFLRALRAAHKSGKIQYAGELEELIRAATKKRWVIHTEPPFGSALQVLKYLSRYTRKVACSNSRLIELKENILSFSWKDYANGAVRKICRVPVLEFMRRFLLHIPPPGFVRVRYYGYMAGKNRKARLLELRELILDLLPLIVSPRSDGSFKPFRCPECLASVFVLVGELAPSIAGSIEFNSS